MATNRVAVLTAGAVFLAAWLPFNNGLRPEPLIAFGTHRRLGAGGERHRNSQGCGPRRLAIVVAMFSVTTAPQGLIALAPMLVGARAIARHHRAARDPSTVCWHSSRPLAASLSLIFVIVFRDQTLATVAESARIKYVVGPTIAWYQEFLRYYFLTVEDSADSSVTRRFAVLVMLLCLFGMIAVLLRRGNLPGVASGPVWRLIGTTAVGLLLLTFTPTKWAVQFGAFAGLAGALGAVTAFAFARVGLHTRRNLAMYVTALLFILAWATSGINALVLRRQLRRAVVRQATGDRGHPASRSSSWCSRWRRACWPAGCTSGWTTPDTPRSPTPAATARWRPRRCWWWPSSWSCSRWARWPRAPRSATPSTPPPRQTPRRWPPV